MAFENFPQADPQTTETTATTTTGKNKKFVILTSILVAALLGTWGYILFDKNKTAETIVQKDNTIATTSSQRDELQKELEDATMRYDMLKTTNSKNDSTITAKDREIDEKKARVSQLLSKVNATQDELGEARRLIASMNGDIEVYKNQVAILQGQKVQLIQEKAMVTTQRNQALKEYDSATMVIKQKNDLLEVGSTLQATNFNIVGINEKSSGKEKTTTTAKKVDKLRITFDLAENMIASTGAKEIYVRITAPDGSVIAVPALGSGTFVTRDGDQKTYTQKLNVKYTQNMKKTVSFDWDQNADFLKGDYKIEVYNNGFKVGDAYKPLKKGGLFS